MDLFEGLFDLFIWLDIWTVVALFVCAVLGAGVYVALVYLGFDGATAIQSAVAMTIIFFVMYLGLSLI